MRCQRRHLGWFQDEGVAGGKRRCRFPAGNLHRVVPGADTGTDAKRHPLAIGDGVGIAPHVAGAGLRQRAEIFHRVRAARHIGRHRLAEAFADIHHLKPRQLVIILAQQLRGAPQNPAALMAAAGRPFHLRGAGSGDRRLQNGPVGRLNPGDHLAGGRIDLVDGGAGTGDFFAADKGSADLHRALLFLVPSFHPATGPGATAKTQSPQGSHVGAASFALRRQVACGRLAT